MTKMPAALSEYRESLQKLEQQMQSEYDKAIMALSGGALGISLTFLKDVVVKEGVCAGAFLVWAWVSWGCSIACTLISFQTSAWALRVAVRQTDDQSIYSGWAGGILDIVTRILNIAAGIFFLIGVGFVAYFVSKNIPRAE
jgi:hypothetical protein